MSNKEIAALLEQLYRQAQMQFGASVIKSRWMHDGDGCPGCGRKISVLKYKGKDTVSLNAFIYREHGVLIAYLLCGKCARHIVKAADKGPLQKMDLHDKIETTLKQAFLKHLGH